MGERVVVAVVVIITITWQNVLAYRIVGQTPKEVLRTR